MRTAFVLASLASMGASQDVNTVMITSDAPEPAVQHAVGEYNYDGEAHGYPRYACTVQCSRNKIIYRGATGLWSITGSNKNVAQNKGTIISNSKTSDTPVGLTFRFYSDGVWKQDKSFKVVDVTSLPIPGEGAGPEGRKASVLEQNTPAAAAATTATTATAVPVTPADAPPVNPPPRVARKVDKKLEAVAAAAAAAAATAPAATQAAAAAAPSPRLGVGGGAWRRSAGAVAATSATWFVGVPTFKVVLKALSVHRGVRGATAAHVHDAYQRAAHFQFINVQGGFAEGPPAGLAQ